MKAVLFWLLDAFFSEYLKPEMNFHGYNEWLELIYIVIEDLNMNGTFHKQSYVMKEHRKSILRAK